MQLTNKQQAALISFMFAVVTLLGAFFGWEIKTAPALTFTLPNGQTQQVGALTSGTNLDNLALSGTLDVTGVSTLGTANVTTLNATTLDATTLKMDSVAFTGAVKYGTAATYTSGTSITHGFAVTPTVCIISPMQAITSTYTLTATGFSTNMPSTASPIYWMCGK